MIKNRELLEGDSTLNKAQLNEPIFILRASDILAPIVVKYWATIAQDAGVDRRKIREAYELALTMTGWPNRKIPN